MFKMYLYYHVLHTLYSFKLVIRLIKIVYFFCPNVTSDYTHDDHGLTLIKIPDNNSTCA